MKSLLQRRPWVSFALSLLTAIVIFPALACWGRWLFWSPPFFSGMGSARSGAFNFGARNWATYSHWWWSAIMLFIIWVGLLIIRWIKRDDLARKEPEAHPGNAWYERDKREYDEAVKETQPALARLRIMAVVAFVVWLPFAWFTVQTVSVNNWGFAEDAKDKASHYTAQTTFELPTLEQGETPYSVDRLVRGANYGDDSIDTAHDIPVDVVRGGLPEHGWLSRPHSLEAAFQYMKNELGSQGGTVLRHETIAFIHDVAGDTPLTAEQLVELGTATGYFSALRDGSGKDNFPEGVAYWDGTSAPGMCRFEGDHRLTRSLQGTKGNSLRNFLLENRAGIFYNDSDVYGYCDEQAVPEPHIVIPTLRVVRSGQTAAVVPGCVLHVSGSPDGTPIVEPYCRLEPGQLPGPVYPSSLAAMQREQLNWAFGRKYMNAGWGFDRPALAENSDNASEFLLRDAETGRPTYVTPLRANRAGNEAVLAYAQVPGDTMRAGKLNPMTVTVLNDRDNAPRANTLRMAADITTVVNGFEPAFFNNGGRLQELTPGLDGHWTAFVVQSNGSPRFNVDILPGHTTEIIVKDAFSNQVVTTRRNARGVDQTDQPSGVDLSQVSDEELLAELRRRMADQDAVDS